MTDVDCYYHGSPGSGCWQLLRSGRTGLVGGFYDDIAYDVIGLDGVDDVHFLLLASEHADQVADHDRPDEQSEQ